MCNRLNGGMNNLHRNFLTGIFVRAHRSATKPGVTKVLTHFSLAVNLARRNVVTHSVDLVVSPPKLSSHRMEIVTYGVSHTICVDFTSGAIAVHANNATNAGLIIEC